MFDLNRFSVVGQYRIIISCFFNFYSKNISLLKSNRKYLRSLESSDGFYFNPVQYVNNVVDAVGFLNRKMRTSYLV